MTSSEGQTVPTTRAPATQAPAPQAPATQGPETHEQSLDAVVEELYGLVPPDFVAARDARAAEARRRGDRGAAKAIKGLRRPTTSAWLANYLVRQRPTEIDQLLALGGAMRDAQDQLVAEDLRQLARRRHQVVVALSREAEALAAAADVPVSETVQRELTDTLEAALADRGAGAALRRGQLTAALHYAGFSPDGLNLEVTPAVEPSDQEITVVGDPDGPREVNGQQEAERQQEQEAERQRILEAAEAARHEAQVAEAEARRRREDKDRVVEGLEDRHGQVVAALAELRARLLELEHDEADVAEHLSVARQDRDDARDAVRLAGEQLARADERLRCLESPSDQ